MGFGLVFAAVVAVNFVVAYRTKPAYQAMIPGQAGARPLPDGASTPTAASWSR